MKKNIVLSQPQVTIDYTFRVPEHVEAICGEFVQRKLFEKHHELLENIARFGLHQDHRIIVDSSDLEKALDYVRCEYPEKELAQVGGNPAIGALRGYYLGKRDRDPSLPVVRYTGIRPTSLDDFINQQATKEPIFHEALEQVFDKSLCVEIEEKPRSLALEGHYKIIFTYGKGRTLDYIDADNFSEYLKRLKPMISGIKDRKALFAFLSIPRPIDSASRLFDQIKKIFIESSLFFLGCSSFRDGNSLDREATEMAWNLLLKKAHILSMNETELGDLHTVIVGKGRYQEMPLCYKLLELPTESIKVCHGAYGALMDPGPDPERVINAEAFGKDPAAFLEESLRLATDGATYGIASPSGHDATEAGVRIFSATVSSRNTHGFRTTFLNVLESAPAGLIAVPTPIVPRSMSVVTGVGARFDGLLATFLMRS